ncbi:MAG: hypothetical protein V1691_00140 [Chloroflexota bacterium]
MLRIGLNTSDLDRECGELEAKLDFMASHNPEMQSYVDELEKEYVETAYVEPLDISPTEGVRLAEEFLKGEEKG